eukprot:Rmarinus@m.3005
MIEKNQVLERRSEDLSEKLHSQVKEAASRERRAADQATEAAMADFNQQVSRLRQQLQTKDEEIAHIRSRHETLMKESSELQRVELQSLREEIQRLKVQGDGDPACTPAAGSGKVVIEKRQLNAYKRKIVQLSVRPAKHVEREIILLYNNRLKFSW